MPKNIHEFSDINHCMQKSSKAQGDCDSKLLEDKKNIEFNKLLNRATVDIESLTHKERECLTLSGYHYLENGNPYMARCAFEALQDFRGLREVVKQYRNKKEIFDLQHALALLEDYEGVAVLLNRLAESADYKWIVGTRTFYCLEEPFHNHVEKFLEKNQAPRPTGHRELHIDLPAIRNLSKNYDIAVPIARGGLYQGAIADLWGMPTRIVDISAHNRKVPTGEWINPVAREDFDGKRVLLFDKDAVTGASVRQAVKMLAPYNPASIGIYFTYKVIPDRGTGAGGTCTIGLPEGLEIFSPHNAPLEKAGDAYLEAHEKLGTLYGRRRLIERLHAKEIILKLESKYTDLAQSMNAFMSNHLRVFDSLNPYLPGVSEMRENILSRIGIIHKNCNKALSRESFENPVIREGFKRILDETDPLPDYSIECLVKARYQKQAEDMAKKRGVENLHYPMDPLSAFCVARRAAKKGFDIALIVGPEGFAYEPYFRDLGLPTAAINIPESEAGRPRSIKLFDDLSSLRGKKVLVVEDDVRTGATLQKVIEALKPHQPKRLALYLGLPKQFHIMKNIPPDFKDTFIPEEITSPAAIKEFSNHLETKGLRIFKNTKRSTK